MSDCNTCYDTSIHNTKLNSRLFFSKTTAIITDMNNSLWLKQKSVLIEMCQNLVSLKIVFIGENQQTILLLSFFFGGYRTNLS